MAELCAVNSGAHRCKDNSRTQNGKDIFFKNKKQSEIVFHLLLLSPIGQVAQEGLRQL